MGDSRTFAFLYGAFKPLLVVLGMGPGLSVVELNDEELHVRMGWAFQARIPRAAITGARPVSGTVGGIGVHGWRGRWLVNGSMDRIVAVDIDPSVRAVATGFPVHLHYLALSLEEPDAFVAALTG
jgi:spermidine synthase